MYNNLMNNFFNPEQQINIKYTLSLVSAVINEIEPKEPDFAPDWEFIFRFTKSHFIDNTVFYAVEKLNNKPQPELFKKWRDIRNKCIHRNMIQRQEFAAVCSCLDKNDIEYMNVKGFSVSTLYPDEAMRYMGDLDILIKDRRDDAVNLLLEMGYTLKENGIDYDRPLVKSPFMVVELHNSLFPMYSPYRSNFEDVFSKASKNDNRYTMSGEDFYVYETAHLYKHFSGSGTGIRSIMDFYLVNKKLLPKLDFSKIKTELNKLGLAEFSDKIYKLAEKWFENEDYESFSDDEKYILTSGLYGTKEHSVKNKTKAKSDSEYIRERLFPPKELMYEIFPNLQKRPFLLPFYYTLRFFRGAFFKRKKLKNEYKILKSTKNETES